MRPVVTENSEDNQSKKDNNQEIWKKNLMITMKQGHVITLMNSREMSEKSSGGAKDDSRASPGSKGAFAIKRT